MSPRGNGSSHRFQPPSPMEIRRRSAASTRSAPTSCEPCWTEGPLAHPLRREDLAVRRDPQLEDVRELPTPLTASPGCRSSASSYVPILAAAALDKRVDGAEPLSVRTSSKAFFSVIYIFRHTLDILSPLIRLMNPFKSLQT